MELKLQKKIILTGTIEALTGLHIGGSNMAMAIGGTDKMVVRNPIDNKPYIPGSSLKGKMRSLLEISAGKLGGRSGGGVENGAYQRSDTPSTLLFGNALKPNEETETNKQRPSRVIVRDAHLTDDSAKLLDGKTDLPYSEVKTEVVIDRITSKASPRQMERVPSGAVFTMNIVLNIFEDDPFSEEILLSNLFKGLRLVQDDYMGGSGSRGYGQVKFKISSAKGRTNQFYTETAGAEDDLSDKIPVDLK